MLRNLTLRRNTAAAAFHPKYIQIFPFASLRQHYIIYIYIYVLYSTLFIPTSKWRRYNNIIYYVYVCMYIYNIYIHINTKGRIPGQ